MNKQDVITAPFYERYIGLITEDHLITALEDTAARLRQTDTAMLEQIGDQVYAPGKWTIRDIYQHLIDCERVMSYRAMRFARNDKSVLPPFDEDHFAAEAGAGIRRLQDILEELMILRQSSIKLFRSFIPEAARRTGLCMGAATSVAALGYIIAGHQQHHLNIIEERYLPLIRA